MAGGCLPLQEGGTRRSWKVIEDLVCVQARLEEMEPSLCNGDSLVRVAGRQQISRGAHAANES
jgi:hypothetical protein